MRIEPCPTCRGTGGYKARICPNCDGSGIYEEERAIDDGYTDQGYLIIRVERRWQQYEIMQEASA